MKKQVVLAALALVLSTSLSACGSSARAIEQESAPVETNPIQAIRAEIEETKATTAVTTTATSTSTTTTTTTATETTTVATTTEPVEFELTDEKVADKMYDFFSDKGYTTAQIAGIIGNADIESGLEPSRGVPGGGFGLFQLMDCPQRSAMIEEMNARGVGKYATSTYWALDASDFDSEEDMNTFLEVMLEYTMNPDDPTWYNELHSAQSPEEASEIFLVHYERAVNGGSPIEYYSDYAGRYYQATESRRNAARSWYDYLESR